MGNEYFKKGWGEKRKETMMVGAIVGGDCGRLGVVLVWGKECIVGGVLGRGGGEKWGWCHVWRRKQRTRSKFKCKEKKRKEKKDKKKEREGKPKKMKRVCLGVCGSREMDGE